MSLGSDLRKLARLSAPELLLLAQTFVWLGGLRIAIAVFPFQKIAGCLGLTLTIQESVALPLEAQMADIKRIQWAISAAARRTPWDSACLAQSLTGASLLRRKNIPARLYLGLAKDKSGTGYCAHAWLRCGETILTGAGGHERFHVIAVFSSVG